MSRMRLTERASARRSSGGQVPVAYAAAGRLPIKRPYTNPVDGARGQQALNSVDYNLLLRGALVRMDRWVSREEDPPPSRYPRLADGTAVVSEQPRSVFTAIPGVSFPPHLPQVIRLDCSAPRADTNLDGLGCRRSRSFLDRWAKLIPQVMELT
jgi:hypothetical protein